MAASSSAPPNWTDKFMWRLPLYNAVLRGDLKSVRGKLSSFDAWITENGDTTLHVAVGIGRANHIVEYLLTQMSEQQVGIRNNDENTALSVAAIVGNVVAAKMLLNKDSALCGAANNCGWVPVILAAAHAHKDMTETLLEATKSARVPLEKYAIGESGAFFVNCLILAGFYDLALRHISRFPQVAVQLFGGDNSLLSAIASKPSAFPSGKRLNFWQRFIYHCIPLNPVDTPDYAAPIKRGPNARLPGANIGPVVPKKPKEWKNGRLGWIWSYIASLQTLLISVLKKSEIYELKLMHHQVHQLVKLLAPETGNYERSSLILRPSILLAAELGVHEVVEEIVLAFPHAIRFTDPENHSLFHLAVMNRQEKVFNLVFQMSNSKDLLLTSQDTDGNNILHLAGSSAPQHRLNLISGAALKMQHELKWFKEVEKTVRPGAKNDKNSEGKTPAMVFTEEHKYLVKEGERWMRDTASSCSLVAALIATVVFAAAITVPGGNINDNGHPVFLKDAAFIIFGISDVFSLFSSMQRMIFYMPCLKN